MQPRPCAPTQKCTYALAQTPHVHTLCLALPASVRVVDPFKASYGVDSALYAVSQLAQTTMRSELGRITLDKVSACSMGAPLARLARAAKQHGGTLPARQRLLCVSPRRLAF